MLANLILGAVLLLSAPDDSLRLARLDSALVGYTAAIERADVKVKAEECDFLIGSVSDSLTSRHVALWLWDRYKESRLMGDEAVAIHVYDKWFKTGKIAMRSEFDRMEADVFCNFNRNTLLGMTAPGIELAGPCCRKRTVLPQEGKVNVLFFYDTACAKCRLMSGFLPATLSKIDFPAVFHAVYCGTDRKAWRKWRRDFKFRSRHVDVVHSWDPECESDYLRLYGVTSTPKMYVTLEDGEIIGRRLEIESLEEIISYLCVYYGQKEN